ncbi:MAG: hypothetical protein ACE5EA_01815 [Nitrospirota bacterium]
MSNLNLERLNPVIREKFSPFLEEILNRYRENIHSIHVTGTAITDDFNTKRSDVNSIFVLKEMEMKFLELIAPLGKKYGKQKVAAPLIMTPEYIKRSLDVFPVEFMNFKLIHTTVLGEDIFKDIEINRMDLRHQCERELKVNLIGLRQGYISSMGNIKILTENLTDSITGYIPLFRGIIALFEKEPPVNQRETIKMLAETAGVNTDIFAKVLKNKHEQIKFSIEEVNTIFKDYYTITEKLGRIVDEIKN